MADQQDVITGMQGLGDAEKRHLSQEEISLLLATLPQVLYKLLKDNGIVYVNGYGVFTRRCGRSDGKVYDNFRWETINKETDNEANELILCLEAQTGIDAVLVAEFLRGFFKTVNSSLLGGDSVTLDGIGVFRPCVSGSSCRILFLPDFSQNTTNVDNSVPSKEILDSPISEQTQLEIDENRDIEPDGVEEKEVIEKETASISHAPEAETTMDSQKDSLPRPPEKEEKKAEVSPVSNVVKSDGVRSRQYVVEDEVEDPYYSPQPPRLSVFRRFELVDILLFVAIIAGIIFVCYLCFLRYCDGESINHANQYLN
ncbi:MAG: hypothetical protein QM654_10645 [Dysgonamonadaceae bacterium]